MKRSFKLSIATVAILAVMCSGAWAGTINIPADGTPIDWADGNTYVITGPVTISDRITVNGSVTLRLTDGCTLSADKGISVKAGTSLTIEGGTGSSAGRSAATGDLYFAAIGGAYNESGGTITIKGGTVTANGGGYAAGIGGGCYGSGGTITIKGGTVTANGGEYAAAIGGGHKGSSGTITIDSGTVRATSKADGAGIGGGREGSGDTITINGGTVIATYGDLSTGDASGAGIGGGYDGSSGIIKITGGSIQATTFAVTDSPYYAAAIGGGGSGGDHDKTSCDITISGGTVIAQSYSGAAIGGGAGSGGTITITGGTVTGSSQYYGSGAGIGGGVEGSGITITITGGVVKGYSQSGAGIGSGENGSNADIKILGGMVTASSTYGGEGIGDGKGAKIPSTTALSSGPDGHAWIHTSSVCTNTTGFNGTIFDAAVGGNGKVYGSATVSGDAAIPKDKTLVIPTGQTLTIKDGAMLTISADAKLTNEDGGKLDSRNGSIDKIGGDIANDGSIYLSDSTTVADIKALGIPRTEGGRIWAGSKKYFNDGTEDVSPSPSFTPGKYTDKIDLGKSDVLWDARVGGDMTIYISVDLAKFDSSVSLDGVPLVKDTATISNDFGAREGSTVITIWEKTLREHITTDGEHTAEVIFDDGSAIHTFTVLGTGETRHSSGGACTAGAAAFVAIAALALRRRNR